MTLVHRVLPTTPVASFADYVSTGGGTGLRTAAALGPDGVLDELDASGLRGRGGAGFPTGRKWRTVRANCSEYLPASIVVNAAEGEPGTFKDRTILRTNPYQILEGALIAARTINADEIVVATKRTFRQEVARLRVAADDIRRAGWADHFTITLFEGPSEYLYGEETALLEAIDGRFPLPRIAPPHRRGVREVVTTNAALESGSGLSARVTMAGPNDDLQAPPTLVNNVETFAHVTHILARGATWFRAVGTPASPGTVVCTITGSTRHHGVGEVPMGTPLRDAINLVGGGARPGRRLVAVLPGVANALVSARHFDQPTSYEGPADIGSGIGSAGFLVLDDHDDLVAVVAGVSRFLAVESCGQCTPCKLAGLHICDLLARLARCHMNAVDVEALRTYVEVVADSARCSLATQHQTVVRSLLQLFPEMVAAHLDRTAAPTDPMTIAEIRDIRDGTAIIDGHHVEKQPDWTYDRTSSGRTPAARLAEHRDTRPEDKRIS